MTERDWIMAVILGYMLVAPLVALYVVLRRKRQ